MDTKPICFALAVLAAQFALAATTGDDSPSVDNSASAAAATGQLQQPQSLLPQPTVRLARLPRPEPAVDIAAAFDAVPLPSPSPVSPRTGATDRMVRPATATAPIAANPERVANLLVQARELARRATNLRDFEQVMQLCHEAIACGPTPQQADSLGRFAAWVSNARGELLLKAGNEFDAFEAFQEAVLLDADCWEALHNRGVTLAANQKPQEALADFARVIELAPRFGSVFRNRGELYTSLGQPALAVDDFSRAIQLEPRIPEHRIARAKAHVDLNHLAEAVQDLTAALQANPQLAEALAMRANIYYTLGYWEQAIDDYQQALRLQPRSLSAYQGLAWMLATCPDDKYRHADKALESATRALKLGDASDARLLDTVAAAYAEAGDFAQAVKFAQQAVVMGGDSQSQAYRSRLELYRQGQPFRSPQLP